MKQVYGIVLLFLIAAVAYYVYQNKMEHFGVYKRNPYEYYESGATPMNFYEFPVYRKPYMYPQQFYKSYPLPHLSYYEDALSSH